MQGNWVMVASANGELPPNLVGIFLRLEGRWVFFVLFLGKINI